MLPLPSPPSSHPPFDLQFLLKIKTTTCNTEFLSFGNNYIAAGYLKLKII